jgi:ATP-dependent helicase/nuclease subunit B
VSPIIEYVAPERVVSACAQVLADRPDDFANALIVVGNVRMLPQVRAALVARTPGRARLLPTLRVRPQSDRQRDRARELLVYSALRDVQTVAGAARWSLARELVQLSDAFTAARVQVPGSLDDWRAALQRAHLATDNPHFGLEARWTHAVWRILASAPDDPVRAAATTLAGWIAAASATVILADCELTPLELSLLDSLAQQRPDAHRLVRIEPVLSAPATSRTPRALSIAQAWQPLAAAFEPDRAPAPSCEPFTVDHCTWYSAHTLHDEASAAAARVLELVAAGETDLALIAFDRTLARRLRALLERRQILLRDEYGWPLSTTSAATPLLRFLKGLAEDLSHADLADLLASPFTFGDVPADARYNALRALRQVALKTHWRRGLGQLQDALAKGPPRDLAHLLGRISAAYRRFAAEATLTHHLAALQRALGDLRLDVGWVNDAAGERLMELLRQLDEDVRGSPLRLSLAEWLCWFTGQLEAERYADLTVDSPVVLTSLAATRGRAFRHVLLLGAAQSAVQDPGTGATLLSPAVRSELGLPTQRAWWHRQAIDLTALLAAAETVFTTWRGHAEPDPAALAPWLSLLRGAANSVSKRPAAQPAAATRRPAPAPNVGPEALPARLPVSAAQDLLECPYRFFARRVLGLRPLPEIGGTADAGMLGSAVHAMLQSWHREFPVFTGVPDDRLVASLRAIAQRELGPLAELDYTARERSLTVSQFAAGYIAWQRGREAAGWRFAESEVSCERPLSERHTLSGRLDRVDQRDSPQGGASEHAVLDYKTGNVQVLREAADDPDESLQLTLYAALWEEKQNRGVRIGEAAFVSLKEGQARTLAAPLPLAGDAAIMRVANWVTRVGEGAPLPAHGNRDACRWCEASGLCRRDWQERA